MLSILGDGQYLTNEDKITIAVNEEIVAVFNIPPSKFGYKKEIKSYHISKDINRLVISAELSTIDTEENVSPEVVSEEPRPANIALEDKSEKASIVDTVVDPRTSNSTLIVEPIVTPPKKTRAPRKPKDVAIVEDNSPNVGNSELNEDAPPSIAPTVVVEKNDVPKVQGSPSSTMRVLEIAKLIKFYCKSAGMKPSEITIEKLKADVFDIVENDSDLTIESAIVEARK